MTKMRVYAQGKLLKIFTATSRFNGIKKISLGIHAWARKLQELFLTRIMWMTKFLLKKIPVVEPNQ